MMKHRRSLIYAAAALSFVAELLHLWELPTNYELWWIYGTFLLIAAIAQGAGAAILLFWPRLQWIILGILGNVLLIVAYVLVRVLGDRITMSLPPLASEELNVAVAGIEVIIIILLSIILWQGLHSKHPAQPRAEGKRQNQQEKTLKGTSLLVCAFLSLIPWCKRTIDHY